MKVISGGSLTGYEMSCCFVYCLLQACGNDARCFWRMLTSECRCFVQTSEVVTFGYRETGWGWDGMGTGSEEFSGS